MKITQKELKKLADGLHPRFIYVEKDWDWESLIVALGSELLIARETIEKQAKINYQYQQEVGKLELQIKEEK